MQGMIIKNMIKPPCFNDYTAHVVIIKKATLKIYPVAMI